MDKRLEDKLKEAVAGGRLPHSLLLHGFQPHDLSVNGEAVARLLLHCEDLSRCPDFFPISPKGKMRQISIDDIRDLIQKLNQSSFAPGLKIALIYDGDRLHRSAANALLKLLEEPPRHVFLLITSCHFYEVLGTIRSRCPTYCLKSERRKALPNPAWQRWLDDWKWLTEKAFENSSQELLLDAYALIANFPLVLDILEKESDETDLSAEKSDMQEGGMRRFLLEHCLGDCAHVLFETSMAMLSKDLHRRRLQIHHLAKRLEAIETAAHLLSLNYGEISAVESFVLPLFH